MGTAESVILYLLKCVIREVWLIASPYFSCSRPFTANQDFPPSLQRAIILRRFFTMIVAFEGSRAFWAAFAVALKRSILAAALGRHAHSQNGSALRPHVLLDRQQERSVIVTARTRSIGAEVLA